MTDWGVHLIDPLHQCFGEVDAGVGRGAGR